MLALDFDDLTPQDSLGTSPTHLAFKRQRRGWCFAVVGLERSQEGNDRCGVISRRVLVLNNRALGWKLPRQFVEVSLAIFQCFCF